MGNIGAHPGVFNTVRYNEKILQASGITVTTVDLSEILGNSSRLSDDASQVKANLTKSTRMPNMIQSHRPPLSAWRN